MCVYITLVTVFFPPSSFILNLVWPLNFCGTFPDAGFMSENLESGMPTGKGTDADPPLSAPPCLRVSLTLGMKNLASGNPTCYSGNLRPVPLFQYAVGCTRVLVVPVSLVLTCWKWIYEDVA